MSTEAKLASTIAMQTMYSDKADTKNDDPTFLSSEKKLIEVGVRLRIDQLISINTSTQQYSMTAAFDKSWPATTKDIVSFKQNPKEYFPEIVPSIQMKNRVDSSNNRYQHWSNGNTFTIKTALDSDELYNCQRIKFSGTFTEEFELENFPFDVQDLSVVVGMNAMAKNKVYKFVPDRTHGDYVTIEKTWCSTTEWSIENAGARATDIDLVYARTGGKRAGTEKNILPYVVFRVQTVRRWKSVFLGVIVWMTMLGMISFCIFGYEPTDVNGRLGFAVTMILTIIAFQFVISSQLPNVPYLTLVDKYNFGIFVFVLLLSVEAFVVGFHGEGLVEDSEFVDNWFAVAAIALFTFGHIIFCFYCFAKYKFERSKLKTYFPLKVRMLARFRQDLDDKNPNQFRRLPREQDSDQGREYSVTQSSYDQNRNII